MQLTFPDLAFFEGKLYGLHTIVLGRMKITHKYWKGSDTKEEESFRINTVVQLELIG